VSYFSQNKGDRDGGKKAVSNGEEVRAIHAATMTAKPVSETASTLGSGMVITGNIVCDGAVQIHGRVVGDIHVGQLVICDGAQVEGNVTAQDVAVHGSFKGTIRGNNVRLHGNAVIDGEIFNRSLKIEENVQFEGVSRRLDKPVDAPSRTQLNGERPAAFEMGEAPPLSTVVS
jgi:cytoskeletal protein CcmA (bactofilin family)